MIKNLERLKRGDVIVDRGGDRCTFLGFSLYNTERVAVVETPFSGVFLLSLDYFSDKMSLVDDGKIDFATLQRGTELQIKEDGKIATFIAYVEDVDDTYGVVVLTEGVLAKYSPSEFTLPEKRLVERWINVSEYQDDEGDYEIDSKWAFMDGDSNDVSNPGFRWVKVTFEE